MQRQPPTAWTATSFLNQTKKSRRGWSWLPVVARSYVMTAHPPRRRNWLPPGVVNMTLAGAGARGQRFVVERVLEIQAH